MQTLETVAFTSIILIILLSVFLVNNIINHKKEIKKIKLERQVQLMFKPEMSYTELLDIVETAIADVIMDMDLRFTLNEVKYIKNIPDETVDGTAQVMSLVSENVIEQLKCYVTEKFIIQYISRNIRGFLLEYTRTHKKG